MRLKIYVTVYKKGKEMMTKASWFSLKRGKAPSEVASIFVEEMHKLFAKILNKSIERR